jgi:hypothetical protein
LPPPGCLAQVAGASVHDGHGYAGPQRRHVEDAERAEAELFLDATCGEQRHSEPGLEAYHQLRLAIALIGNTELDIFLTNQSGRLLALVIIAYNSILLSAVLERHPAAGDEATIARLRKISPVAWQSILFPGRYLFHGPRHPIDIDAVLGPVNLL